MTIALAAACWPAAGGLLGQSAVTPAEKAEHALLRSTGCEVTLPPSKAIKSCTEVLEVRPASAVALALRGNAYYELGKKALAFGDLSAAIALDPDNMFALSRRAALQISNEADINRVDATAPLHASDFEARGFVRVLRGDYAAALIEYSAGLQLEPTDPLLLVNRAASSVVLRDLDTAMADFEKLAEAHPEFASGHHHRGSALIARKRFDEALLALDKAIQLDPDRPQFYAERGRAHLERGRSYVGRGTAADLEMALTDLDKAVAMNRSLAAAHYTRGLVHLERRDYDRAIGDLGAVVALNRRFPGAHAARGHAFAQRGDYDRAIADYSEALQLDPRHAETWYRRGTSLKGKGELDRALTDLGEAISLAPKMAQAYAERADVRLRKNDFALAVEDATKAIALQPWMVQAFLKRAFAHRKLGQLEPALADYNKAIELLPQFADLYLQRAEVLEALGRFSSAGADRARAARPPGQAPSTPQATPPPMTAFKSSGTLPSADTIGAGLKAAESQITRGDYDLAIAQVDKILAIHPGLSAPYALRGFAYSGKKDYTRALADASKAIALNSSAPLGFFVRCHIYLHTRAPDKALTDCNKAIEIGPPNAIAHALRGQAHLGLKAYQLAIDDFDKAIAMGATASQATYGRGLAYVYSKAFSKAADDFRKVLEAEPSHRGATLALRLLTQPLSVAPMQVNLVRDADPKCGDQCAEWIAAQGRIDGNTPWRFRAVLKSLGSRKLPVFIDSMGGSLPASYDIGRMIRARNLDVYVTRTEPASCPSTREVCRKAEAIRVTFGLPRGKLATCASACTNILAAGSARSVGPTALVGIHQAAYYAVHDGTLAILPNRKIPESVYVRMKDYFVEMGIDPNLMSRLLATPHREMYWLTHDELRASRLANEAKSGEELLTGGERDEWIVVSPRAVENLAKPIRDSRPHK